MGLVPDIYPFLMSVSDHWTELSTEIWIPNTAVEEGWHLEEYVFPTWKGGIWK
jgi:hypothetical protein